MSGSSLAGITADEAIARLMNEYADRVHRLGLRLCSDPERAHDLVQETFIRALTAWDGFDGRSQPSTWLYTIASRACQRMERLRAGEPARKTSLEQLLPTGQPAVMTIPADGETPLDRLEREDVIRTVRAAIDRLPLQFRLPVVLKEMEGVSIRGTAEVLGLKPATVKTRLHRARLLIREELSRPNPRRSSAPSRPEASACLDLLWAKQEAVGRGVEFPIPGKELCERCSPTYATLDGASEGCHAIGNAELPEHALRTLRERVED